VELKLKEATMAIAAIYLDSGVVLHFAKDIRLQIAWDKTFLWESIYGPSAERR
jgi:hypothetical protein